MTRSSFTFSVALFVFGWALYLGILFPGFMSVDSVVQLLEARRGEIGDWHSPFMTLLFGVVDQFFPGPVGMLILQITLLWGGLMLFWYAALVPFAPRLGAVLLFLLMFYPPVLGINGAIWKDILMAGMLTVLSGALAGVYSDRLPQGPMIALILVTAFVALLARVNAVFCLTPLLSLLAICIIRPHRVVGFTGAICLSAGLALGIALGSMNINAQIADRSENPMLSVALFDVSGTIAYLPDGERRTRLHSKLPTPLTEGLTPQNLSESYSPRDWQAVFYGDQPGLNALNQSQDTHVPTDTFGALDPEQQSEILASWRHAITTEPKAYLSHRLAAFDWVLAFRKTLWQPVLFDPANYSEEMQQIVPPISEQTSLQKELSLLFNKLAYYPPYKPWLCLAAAMTLLVILLFKPAGHGLEIALLLAVPAHLFGLFLLAPTPDFRYSHVIFLFTGLAFSRAICIFLKQRV